MADEHILSLEFELKKARKDYLEEDNDLIAMGRYKKVARIKRELAFLRYSLPKIREKYEVVSRDSGYSIQHEKFGAVTLYPRANKVHIFKDNTWKTNVKNWLNKNL